MNRRKGVPCGCDADPCGCSPKNHCVKAINNASPDPNGDFTIVAGDNVTITEIQNGIEVDADVGVKTINSLTPDAQGNIDIEDISTEFVAQGNVNVYFTSVGRYMPQRITVTLPSSAEDMVSGYDYLVTASVLNESTLQPVTDVTISLPYGNLTTPTRTFILDVNGGEDIVIYWALYRMKTTHTGLSKIFGAFPSSVTDQEKLVSGTNIKTINAASLLGSGNINLQTPLTAGTDYQVPLVSGTNIKTINNISLIGSGDIQIGGGSGGVSIEFYTVQMFNYQDITDVTNNDVIALYSYGSYSTIMPASYILSRPVPISEFEGNVTLEATGSDTITITSTGSYDIEVMFFRSS